MPDFKKAHLLKLPRYKVESSNLECVAHEPKSNTLVVEFKNGAIYSFSPVTEEAYKALMKADSVGKYFNENIRGNTNIAWECLKKKP